MPIASSKNELWRRLALLAGILIGLALFFYVAPAMVSVTAIDWQQEQADELKSNSGIVTQEKKRLHALPLDEYIQAKTGEKVQAVDGSRWGTFFEQVRLASKWQYGESSYGNRVSEEDKDDFWKPTGPVAVFFKPDEIPLQSWGLFPGDGESTFISTVQGGQTLYLELQFHDYTTSVGAMSSPYRVAPGWLYHPYRTAGIIVMVVGLLIYIACPGVKSSPGRWLIPAAACWPGTWPQSLSCCPFTVCPS